MVKLLQKILVKVIKVQTLELNIHKTCDITRLPSRKFYHTETINEHPVSIWEKREKRTLKISIEIINHYPNTIYIAKEEKEGRLINFFFIFLYFLYY